MSIAPRQRGAWIETARWPAPPSTPNTHRPPATGAWTETNASTAGVSACVVLLILVILARRSASSIGAAAGSAVIDLGAGGVIGIGEAIGIRADIKAIHQRITDAHDSAEAAHSWLDAHLEKGK